MREVHEEGSGIMQARERRLRIYTALRTAHLERFRVMLPAEVRYTKQRYDYDETLENPNNPPLLVSRADILAELLAQEFDVVEINEPLMRPQWGTVLAQIAAIRLADFVRRRHTVISAYCIGLTDPVERWTRGRRLPAGLAAWLTKASLRLLVSGYDRLAMGTAGSWQLLAAYVGPEALAARSKIFPALPAPCSCPNGVAKEPKSFLFVGSFDHRKGIESLMRAWSSLSTSGASLHLVGKGALLDDVREWVSKQHNVVLTVDPPRDVIHQAYRRSESVVLLSQRVGAWREQVGLPIVEGLAHGCRIVTTNETGLASWLVDHGHVVVPWPNSDVETVAALAASAASSLTASAVLGSLPTRDMRMLADDWLLAVDESPASLQQR